MSWMTYHRIEVFLPSNVRLERNAVAAAEAWIREEFRGTTASTKDAPIFNGFYRSSDVWVNDQIVWIIADTLEPLDFIEASLKVLHRTLAALYDAAGRTQDEFWITVAPLQRFVDD